LHNSTREFALQYGFDDAHKLSTRIFSYPQFARIYEARRREPTGFGVDLRSVRACLASREETLLTSSERSVRRPFHQRHPVTIVYQPSFDRLEVFAW
jgi:hypothetical protein